MHGLSVLVSPRPPGIVPEAAPVALLLKAGDLGHLAALPGELGGPAHEGHPGGARPYHTNLLIGHRALFLKTWTTLIIDENSIFVCCHGQKYSESETKKQNAQN